MPTHRTRRPRAGSVARRAGVYGLPVIDETSAGGLIIDVQDGRAVTAVIARRNRGGRLEWCLPKGHLEGAETAEQSPDAAGRAVEAKTALAEALGRLAESAPLVVRSLAFCTEVQSYGCAKRFEKYEFQPNQEVLLYAELENFGTERTPKGCHTSLRSNYQVVDSRGRPIEDHAFAATEEYCQNVRRDYFIGYHLRMPKRIEPGKYSLQLSVEDLKSKKVGQASIEFDVVEAADKKDP